MTFAPSDIEFGRFGATCWPQLEGEIPENAHWRQSEIADAIYQASIEVSLYGDLGGGGGASAPKHGLIFRDY